MAEKISGYWLRSLFGAKRAKSSPVASNPTSAEPFHAVSILPGEHACAAAFRATGQRFLSREAPTLPLPTCDAFDCACRFTHHKDRRAGPRRRNDFGLMSSPHAGPNRRHRIGRRATDK